MAITLREIVDARPIFVLSGPGGLLNAEVDQNFIDLYDIAIDASQLITGIVPVGRLSGTYDISISGNAVTATTADKVANSLSAGTYLLGDPFNGSIARTFSVDATPTNTPNKVVARDVDGNFSASVITCTDLNSTSDRKLKTDIITSRAYDTLQLRGVDFTWKDSGEKASGVIAQELELVLPHLVHTTEDGTKTVSYSGITAYLIETVKEQHKLILELSERVSRLEP